MVVVNTIKKYLVVQSSVLHGSTHGCQRSDPHPYPWVSGCFSLQVPSTGTRPMAPLLIMRTYLHYNSTYEQYITMYLLSASHHHHHHVIIIGAGLWSCHHCC